MLELLMTFFTPGVRALVSDRRITTTVTAHRFVQSHEAAVVGRHWPASHQRARYIIEQHQTRPKTKGRRGSTNRQTRHETEGRHKYVRGVSLKVYAQNNAPCLLGTGRSSAS